MSLPLLIIVTLIYLGVTIDQAARGNMGTALMFAGYTIANLGVMKIV